jgi:hypothetical protein
MQDSVVPIKTEQGIRELAERRHKLHARARSLLIAIHGGQPVADLKRQFQAIGDVGSILDELENLGLITAARGAIAANAPSSAPSAENEGLPPLQLTRAFINETAVAALGLRAFLFTLKLERAYTKAELNELLPEYRRVLAKAKGDVFAEAMTRRAEQMLARA